VAEKPQIQSGSFWSKRQREAHSLHEIPYRACFKPALASHFIENFTKPGEIIFDPFPMITSLKYSHKLANMKIVYRKG
jgi:DNA modification methylase